MVPGIGEADLVVPQERPAYATGRGCHGQFLDELE